MSTLKSEPVRRILKWQIVSRKEDYYYLMSHKSSNVLFKIEYFYYVRRRNILGEKLGLEIDTSNIGKGLVIITTIMLLILVPLLEIIFIFMVVM